MNLDFYPVIGFAGPGYSGKDTAAALLLKRGGYLYSFADPIRDMCTAMGLDVKGIYERKEKEDVIPWLGKSLRYVMQTLGTEWGRQTIHHALWLKLAERKLAAAGPGMVIADVRFENEAAWIREQGGLVVHLKRDRRTAIRGHASEAGISFKYGDKTIDNNDTLDSLASAVACLHFQPKVAV